MRANPETLSAEKLTQNQVYLLDDIHFNPEIYTEPHKWDPSRYLPDRAEDRKKPVSYVGWGTGRHPCCELLGISRLPWCGVLVRMCTRMQERAGE